MDYRLKNQVYLRFLSICHPHKLMLHETIITFIVSLYYEHIILASKVCDDLKDPCDNALDFLGQYQL